jgi:hypothetical protein
MMDLTKLSDADLEAIAAGRIKDVSTEGLRIITGQKTPLEAAGRAVTETAKTVAEAVTPERPQELMQQIGRQLGLTGRAAVTGTLGLPTMASDALISLINKIGGQNIQLPSQAQQQLLTQAGLPEPATPQERVVSDIAGAGFGVLGGYGLGRALPGTLVTPPSPTQAIERFAPSAAGGQAAKELLTQSPAFQIGSGAAAATAAGLGREEGAGPIEQIALGMGAGVLAPSVGSAATVAAQRAATGGRELVRPFTEAGREVIVGNVLRQLAREPETAIQRMESYQPGVPGYQPTTAQASRDIGLAGAVPAVRALDETGRFPAQQIQANQARMAVLDRLAKDAETLQAAKVKRDEVTTPLREQAFAQAQVTPETFGSAIALNVNKTIEDILASPVGKRSTVQQVMRDAQKDISRATTPEELYEIRKDLRIAAQGLLSKTEAGGPSADAFKAAKPQLEQVIRSVDETIESAAPGYKNYLDKYASASRGITRLEAAQEFRGKVLGTTPIVTEPTAAGEYMISQPKFVNAIRAAEKETDLSKMMSKTQMAVVKRVAQDLDEGSITRLTAEPGSNTFKNISIANFIGQSMGKQMFGEVPGVMQKGALAFNWLYAGPDDAIRAVLVDAMLDPKLAARMMRRATNAELIPISQELQRRALRLGYGQVFGLTPE